MVAVYYTVLGLIAFYFLCGVLVVGAALYYLVKTQETEPRHKELVRMYNEMSRKQKAHAWICAIWYGVICWLPVALGYMDKPSEFLNERKK